ncbi:hypothetical protein DEO72_LG6g1816 [Vigna unguiculata]|uniref:PORR domain-containing protein n=1 Tax=Vigna unguiculata TaxID=3917 RepID=A0A4D6MAK5_VIGUN|nr:hypothetical protein DEO72_LG6g1816 [Vigna unguiculata]
MTHLKRLYHVHEIHQLMSNRKRAPFVSLTLMSRWRNILGLNVPVGSFLHKYPPCSTCSSSGRNTCCRVTKRMEELILLEGVVVRQQEMEAVKRVKKLLMMSVSVTLRLHALRMIRRELGLPEDFRDCILGKFSGDFKLVGLEVVELVDWDADLGLARLSYTKPYGRKEVVRVRTCGGIERYEKRVLAVLHELLSLTVEKMVEVDQLAHFRRDLGIEVNVRELLLRHPGYRKTRKLLAGDEAKEESNVAVCEVNKEGSRCRIFEEIVKMVSGFWSSLPLASISLSSASICILLISIDFSCGS